LPDDSSQLFSRNSIANLIRHRREQCDKDISSLIAICNDNSWKLACGDIVYVNSELRPSRVYRIGYGDYEKEVRVAYLDENISARTAGRWVSTARCFKLEVGDTMIATQDVIDASHDRVVLPGGCEFQFRGVDEDGDVILAIQRAQHIVFYQDLDNFSLR